MDKPIVFMIERALNELELMDLFLEGSICLSILIKNCYIISQTDCESKNSVNSNVVYINQNKWSPVSIDLNEECLWEQDEGIRSRVHSIFKSVDFVGEKGGTDTNEYLSAMKECVTKGKRIQFEHAINLLAFYRDSVLHIQEQILFSGACLNILSIAQGRVFCTNSFSELCMNLQSKTNDSYKAKEFAKGIYCSQNLVFESEAASILLHEVVHILEKDNLRPLVGKKIMNEDITIIDSPSVKGSWSNRKYDDFGREIDECVLIKSGVLMNVGSMIKRNLINDEARKRFMINTILLNSGEKEKSILDDELCERLVFSQILGAKNDGKHIILSRCKYRRIKEGIASEVFYVGNVVLKISDIVKKLLPVGKNNCLINGICSNKYYVSYAAPSLLLKDIEMQVY